MANSMGRVEPCACGGSNLHLGAITLHLERQQVADFLQLAQGVQTQAVPIARDPASASAAAAAPAAAAADAGVAAAAPASTRRRRRGRIARVYH